MRLAAVDVNASTTLDGQKIFVERRPGRRGPAEGRVVERRRHNQGTGEVTPLDPQASRAG